MKTFRIGLITTTALIAGSLLAAETSLAAESAIQWIKRASATATGAQTYYDSNQHSLNADGIRAMFASGAPNLVPSDPNGTQGDVFIKNLNTGVIARISTNAAGTGGTGGTGGSGQPEFVGSTGKVLFVSDATDLAGLSISDYQIYIKTLKTNAISLVSTASNGAHSNNSSFWPKPSPDGKRIAFESYASNLVVGDTNNAVDIFVKDLTSGTTSLISRSPGNVLGNSWSELPRRSSAFSPDGVQVLFTSNASNLIAGDTNGVHDVFLKNTKTRAVRRVSTSSSNRQANGASGQPSWSADGNLVAFESVATNLVSGDSNGKKDIFVKNLTTNQVIRVSTRSNGTQAHGDSSKPSISPNGQLVAFTSAASDLVPGDYNGEPDIFVKNLATGKTVRISTSVTGAEAILGSDEARFSPDGTMVSFISQAENLIPGSFRGPRDVYVVKLKP